MYTVKCVLSCHFSLSLSYSHSLSIYLSLPSHLLHHLCSCNKQDSSCVLFHSLTFSSLLILAHPPLQARPPLPGCLTDLFPQWSHHAVRLPCVQKWLRRLCHAIRPAITQQAQPVKTTLLSSFCGNMLQA